MAVLALWREAGKYYSRSSGDKSTLCSWPVLGTPAGGHLVFESLNVPWSRTVWGSVWLEIEFTSIKSTLLSVCKLSSIEEILALTAEMLGSSLCLTFSWLPDVFWCAFHAFTGVMSFGEENHTGNGIFSSHRIRNTYCQHNFIAVDINLDHLAEVVSDRFLQWEVTFPPPPSILCSLERHLYV